MSPSLSLCLTQVQNSAEAACCKLELLYVSLTVCVSLRYRTMPRRPAVSWSCCACRCGGVSTSCRAGRASRRTHCSRSSAAPPRPRPSRPAGGSSTAAASCRSRRPSPASCTSGETASRAANSAYVLRIHRLSAILGTGARVPCY